MLQSQKLTIYLKMLENAPKRVVLMSPKEDTNLLYYKHIEEAKLYLPYIKCNDVVLDLGSGAGFPGIALAIFKPCAKFYLLDKREIHTNFLSNVKSELMIQNVEVVNLDAAMLFKLGLSFDVVVARAVNRIGTILSWVKDVLKQDGIVLLGKKKDIEKELREISPPFILEALLQTSFGYIVIIKKL